MWWDENKISSLSIGVVATLIAGVVGVVNIKLLYRSNREVSSNEQRREVIGRLTADPRSIQVGECSTLHWTVEGAEQIRIDPA